MTATGFPPGPKGHRLLGNLPDFVRDPPGFLTACARDYGDVVPLRFGPWRSVLVNDPDLIGQVLVEHNDHVVKPRVLRRNRLLFGNGLLASDGETWRRHRRLIQPVFQRARVAAYADFGVACAERRIAGWPDGETRDVQDEMSRLTLEIVAKTLFNADVADEAAAVGPALKVVMDIFLARLGRLFLAPERLPTPGNRRLQRAVRRLDVIIDRLIAERRASDADPGDLLSLLLKARDEEDGRPLSPREVRDEAMTFFLAGHETIALALTWVWYLLARHPAAETALTGELQTSLAGRQPTAVDRAQLGYTELVVQEALRLYSSAWAIGRVTTADCALGPYHVPAGWTIVMSPWVTHRDPRFFDEPERFAPERWGDGLAKRLPRYAYFPFGGGPRACIGAALAMSEAVLLVATIAQRARLTLASGQPDVRLQPTITLRPKQGIQMVLHRR